MIRLPTWKPWGGRAVDRLAGLIKDFKGVIDSEMNILDSYQEKWELDEQEMSETKTFALFSPRSHSSLFSVSSIESIPTNIEALKISETLGFVRARSPLFATKILTWGDDRRVVNMQNPCYYAHAMEQCGSERLKI